MNVLLLPFLQQRASASEIGFFYRRRGQQLFACARGDDLAGLQHVAAARDRERHARVLLDEQNSRAAVVQVAYDVEYLFHEYRS